MRKVIAFILYIFYYPAIKRKMNQRGIILSIYGHDPKRESIEKIISWLIDKGYEFITPHEILDFKNGELKKQKPVWLSFDDGWKSNYYELLPILEKYSIPATIFVSTKAIDDGYFWFSKAFENRDSLLYTRVDDLWKMPNSKRVSIIKKLSDYTKGRVAMNETELYNLSECKLIYIANHTHDHVICDMCEKDELKNEIRLCEESIKEYTNNVCLKYFAYPNGNYDKQTVSVLKEMDYQIAATTNLGFISKETDLHKIPRNVLPDNASFHESILQVYGLWTPFFDRIKKILRVKSHK